MILNIGTKNKCKINALINTIKDYSFLEDAIIKPYHVDSDIPEQPMSLEETSYGAKNRAFKSFINCKYSFGIESGIFEFEKNNYFNICICSIYDGNNYFMGFSQAFPIPKKIMKFVHFGQNLSLASLNAKYTKKLNLGQEEGLIGILTNGKITRENYTKSAIQMALINLRK